MTYGKGLISSFIPLFICLLIQECLRCAYYYSKPPGDSSDSNDKDLFSWGLRVVGESRQHTYK